MAIFRPFKAVRPFSQFAQKVAALPYDVMDSNEAREKTKNNPYSFLHVDKAEIDLPQNTDLYSKEVYEKAASNLKKLESDKICFQDTNPCIYIYRQTMNSRSQTGLVGCVSIDDYINSVIKKHEFTRKDKEQDRINHVNYCDANTGPIFLTYRDNKNISILVNKWQKSNEPVYDFVSDSVRQEIWVIDSPEVISKITDIFKNISSLYIADGHHRAASAVNVGQMRRQENPNYTGNEEFNYFLAVLFAQSELSIMDYNRVIKDLNGLKKDKFLKAVENKFYIEKAPQNPYRPTEKHTFGMYLEGQWYKLRAKENTFDESDPVASLDVSILQDNLIAPILDIHDPRTDERIDFVGGIRGLRELERRVNSDMSLAFSLYPTTISELMDIADQNKIMPPKSTWFEPKLLSGLFVHKLK